MSKPRLFRAETIRGEPYHVSGRTLVPVARIVTFGKAQATIGAGRVSGWGGGFVRITPLAVVEETAGGERTVPVVDATARALWRLLGVAASLTLFLALVRCLVSRRRDGRS